MSETDKEARIRLAGEVLLLGGKLDSIMSWYRKWWRLKDPTHEMWDEFEAITVVTKRREE